MSFKLFVFLYTFCHEVVKVLLWRLIMYRFKFCYKVHNDVFLLFFNIFFLLIFNCIALCVQCVHIRQMKIPVPIFLLKTILHLSPVRGTERIIFSVVFLSQKTNDFIKCQSIVDMKRNEFCLFYFIQRDTLWWYVMGVSDT